jgi:hypothetical protein
MALHAGHRFTHTEIELHHDGSATIEHHHEKGPDHNVRYAVSDLDGMHDGLEDNLRLPEKDEEALEEKIHPGIHEEVEKLAEEKK